jgi:hypothetical protein
MQHGCMRRLTRKRGPEVWQFRWSVTGPDGKRLYHKKIIGTVERYPDENAARRCVVGLVSEINIDAGSMNSDAMTVAQLCDHFEQRELTRENTWRSHATKIIYKAYLSRWIRPHWQKHELAEVRTIQVESWLRAQPLAKSSCAKIRNLMSVLFNHACRYELFDRNPIYLVRQSAKRRRPPTVLVPSEIKALVDNLDFRERTLVLLAVSTGLRQSEMFGLKWVDIDFAQRSMSVTRSIVYGRWARARPSHHRSPCLFLRFLPTLFCNGRKVSATRMQMTGFSRASATEVEDRSGAKRSCGNIFVRWRRGLELRSDSDGTHSGTHLLIPQGTKCHFLSSPYCTQIEST